MRMKTLFALLLCICLFPFCAAPAEGEVTLIVGDQTFSASPDATELDLGDLKLPDSDEAYDALEAFIQQLPALTKLDMFSTDIPVKRVLYLGEKYSQIKFGWTILIPCTNRSAGAGPGSQQHDRRHVLPELLPEPAGADYFIQHFPERH